MRSKTPAKEKRDNTCDVCLTKFLTIQALRSHEAAKHPEQKREAEKPDRPKNTPIAPAPVSRVSKRLQLKKEESTGVDAKTTEMAGDDKKTMFPCPSCDKVFTTNFQASRHLQKKHGAASEDNSELQSSPSTKQLSYVEICHICDKPIVKPHACVSNSKGTYDSYVCLGCNEQFQSISGFNRHAALKHQHDLDSMFFKTYEEFNSWKQNMETQVKIKYLILNKSPTTQKYYQCNYVSPLNEFTKTYLCPSTVLVKELTNGFQIYYDKLHFGHVCQKYQLPNEFARNLTNRREEKIVNERKLENERDDILIKLKQILKNISIDAGLLSTAQLKKLFEKILEAQAFLNSCDDADHEPIVRQSMTDVQITNALELDPKRTSVRLKRKFHDKKVKSDTVDPKAKSDSVDKVKSDTVDNVKSDTVDKVKSDTVDAKLKSEAVNDEVESDADEETKIYVEEQIFKENLESPRVGTRSLLQSPSFVDSYKQFVEKQEPNLVGIKKDAKKPVKQIKNVVKTKIGQFIPKSPDEPTAKKTKPNVLKPSKINVRVKDIKYEVREQENDCNILVLKI